MTYSDELRLAMALTVWRQVCRARYGRARSRWVHDYLTPRVAWCRVPNLAVEG